MGTAISADALVLMPATQQWLDGMIQEMKGYLLEAKMGYLKFAKALVEIEERDAYKPWVSLSNFAEQVFGLSAGRVTQLKDYGYFLREWEALFTRVNWQPTEYLYRESRRCLDEPMKKDYRQQAVLFNKAREAAGNDPVDEEHVRKAAKAEKHKWNDRPKQGQKRNAEEVRSYAEKLTAALERADGKDATVNLRQVKGVMLAALNKVGESVSSVIAEKHLPAFEAWFETMFNELDGHR